MSDNKQVTGNNKYSDVTDPEKLRRIEEKREKNKQKMLDNRAKNKAKKEQEQQANSEKKPEEKVEQKEEQKKQQKDQKKEKQKVEIKVEVKEVIQTEQNIKVERQTEPLRRATTTTVHNLPEYDDIELQRVLEYQKNNQIHEAFFNLGVKFKNEQKMGKNRCIMMLEAAKQMIQSLKLEQSQEQTQAQLLGQEMKRHVQQLKGFFTYLGVVLDEGINSSLKLIGRLSTLLDEETDDLEMCKNWIGEQIDSFIRQKVYNSQEEIIRLGDEVIKDGDVILTFARSKLMSKLFNKSANSGKQFTVIVVDNPPYFEGRQMAEGLQQMGIQVIYTLLGSLSKFLPKVSKVMVGGASVLMNGTLVGRVGTALIGAMAHSYRVPFIVCCETYKFSSKSQLDSVAENQLRNPKKIIHSITSIKQDYVNAINLKWDLTPSHFIHMVITELGKVPPTSVPVILGEFERLFDIKKMVVPILN